MIPRTASCFVRASVAVAMALLAGVSGRAAAPPTASSAAPSRHAASTSTSTTPPSPVTYTRDVSPILLNICAKCHRPGEAGPFSLLTYQDAKAHARQIAEVTQRRFMPPWLPAPGPLHFADELRLSNAQIATLTRWFAQGTPEGNPADLPPTPSYSTGWQLGPPDAILRAEKPYPMPASGSDNYWNFILRTPVSRTRWVKAMEIRPGEKRVVHHANLLIDRDQSVRARETDPGAGFPGMELLIESESFDPDSHFLFWKPGTIPAPEPEGLAWRLDPGNDLVLNVHLQPSGKPESILPTVGLYFTDQPATQHPMLLQLENDGALDIPAGEKNFVVTDSFTFPIDVDLLAIYPHAHYLGHDMLATATLPGGAAETLIHIPRWDLNWQAVYRYAQPVRLPKGTIVSMRYTYDNSAANPANPHHPPLRVTAGNRAEDEMAHLWLQVLPVTAPGAPPDTSPDPRMDLQEALSRHRLAQNPANFEAHYNLAAILQARGDLTAAIAEYEAAVRISPEAATVNNALGTALLAAGNPAEAIPHWETALHTRPNYFDPQYNLGLALASQGHVADALPHFETAVRLNPADANAQANLGIALAATGHLPEAKQHLQQALQLDPQNNLAQENLAEVIRQMGK